MCVCSRGVLQDSLAVGGGGSSALYLDCELFGGSTGFCKTFNSPPLTSQTAHDDGAAAAAHDDDDDDGEDFQCSNLELWGFVPAVAYTMPQ